jgi:hypothetical protein
MPTTGLILLDVVVAVFGVILVKKIFTKRSILPPGPSKLPVLENLLDMPTGQEWVTFAKWGKKYGIKFHISFLLNFFIDYLCSRRYGIGFNIRSADDHRKFGENSDGHDGQKECDIL